MERGGGDAGQTASRGSRSLDNYRDHEAKARDWAAGRGGGRIASTAGAVPDSRDRRLQRWRKEGTHTYPKRSNRSLRVESRPGGSWGSVRAQRRKTRLPWSGRRGGAGAGEAKGLVVGGNSGDLSWRCAQSAPRGQDLVGGQGSPMQDRPPSGDRARQRAWGLASAQPGPPHRRGAEAGRTWGVTRAGGPVCVAAGVPRGRFREPQPDKAEGRLRATGPWSRQSGGLSAAGFGEPGISREKMPGPRHRLTRSRARSVGDAGKGALSLPDGFWGGSGRRGPPPPERGGKAAQGPGDERTTSAPASARSPEDRPVPR